MSRKERRLRDYLDHIVQAVLKIERYTEGMNQSAFLENDLVQDAVIRNLEIIGEASRSIQLRHPQFAAEHPELPLLFAYEMRNVLAHGYAQVDLDIVWRTLQRDLPDLRS